MYWVGEYDDSMTPQERKTATESIELYKQTLQGKNYSVQSIKAYLGDLEQFMEWLKKRRVDWDIPFRIQRIDVVEFINCLAGQKSSAEKEEAETGKHTGFSQVFKRQSDHLWESR